ncbi:MAG: recombinase family protein [Lachnospiraceae bacterium]|nr:recombinase family protein [Lachnospiraceae bacterium]
MEVEVIKANNNFDDSSSVNRKERLRVAAYCRVSTSDEEQAKSYDSMVKYYTDLIKKNPDWAFVDVYADKASTGTKAETREDFQRLIADCLAGKIDMVIAKSLSRFARNTLDTLKYVRMLRERQIAIYFEVEKINTIKDGEFLLTILSSVAQQEVENTSAYVKKGLKMKMQRGELVGFQGCLGYDYDPETKTLSINEDEAETVRYIFDRYTVGAGCSMISRELNEKGIMTIRGNPWTSSSVLGIINNEKYTGDILLGKTFTVDPISKRRLENLGEEDRFFIKNHHAPIISHEIFEKAQEIRKRRGVGLTRGVSPGKREKFSRQFAFSCMLECGFCGKNLSRRRWHSSSIYKKTIWQCVASTKGGKRLCPDSKGIPEQVIEEAFVESYRLLSSDNQDVMKEFLKRIEETLGDKTVQLNYDKACRNKKEYAEKRKKLLEKYVDGSVEKDIYELTDKDYQKRISEAVAQIEYFGNLLQDNKNLSRRIEEFERVLEKNQVLEQFDRSVFESMIEKVIVGGIDDEGKKDPYKITFIYKNGFRDSMGQTKSKYGLSKKSGGNVCSHDSVKGEELYSNCEVDARRMRYAFTANEQHRERTITLDVEMEDYHRIKNGTEVTADATE